MVPIGRLSILEHFDWIIREISGYNREISGNILALYCGCHIVLLHLFYMQSWGKAPPHLTLIIHSWIVDTHFVVPIGRLSILEHFDWIIREISGYNREISGNILALYCGCHIVLLHLFYMQSWGKAPPHLGIGVEPRVNLKHRTRTIRTTSRPSRQL